jgi:hypothetical protein
MRVPTALAVFLSVGVAHAQPLPPAPAPPAPAAVADEDLRRQLRQVLDKLERHEAELKQLRAAVAAKPPPVVPPAPPPKTEAWYDKLQIRGYTQIRYNFPGFVPNEKLIRRARLILFGDVHPHVSIYLQPDFASAISDQLGVAILRDWYADVFFDKKREFRLRVGQSKVPYGFENLQSSQNRLPLDRNDALNSAVKDERDLGIFFYWAPDEIRKRFRHLVDAGLKGSGDYGVVALGAYNGQTANRLELNKSPHAIARVTYPFAIGNQFLEIGGGGFYGISTIKVEDASDGTVFTSASEDKTFHDGRGHATVVLYPKPFGFTAEYTVGVGPQLGVATPTVVDNHLLFGGYVQLAYKIDGALGTLAMIPYLRGTMYDGGKKHVTNVPRYEVREIETGIEVQFNKSLELVLAYMISNRTSDKFPYAMQYGHVGRTQLQFNY